MPKKNKDVQQHDELSRVFSENLRKLRGNRSQSELAKALGIEHQSSYHRYEAGLIPGGRMLHKMAKVLGVPIDQLFKAGAVDGVSPIFALDEFIRENFKAKPLHELKFDEVEKCLSYALEMVTKSVMPVKSIYALAFLLLNSELQKRMNNPPPEVRARIAKWMKDEGLSLPIGEAPNAG